LKRQTKKQRALARVLTRAAEAMIVKREPQEASAQQAAFLAVPSWPSEERLPPGAKRIKTEPGSVPQPVAGNWVRFSLFHAACWTVLLFAYIHRALLPSVPFTVAA
jgi:hypothetical protein